MVLIFAEVQFRLVQSGTTFGDLENMVSSEDSFSTTAYDTAEVGSAKAFTRKHKSFMVDTRIVCILILEQYGIVG